VSFLWLALGAVLGAVGVMVLEASTGLPSRAVAPLIAALGAAPGLEFNGRKSRVAALRAMVAAENGDEPIEEDSLEMMAGVMSLGETFVREVMVPRMDITAIPNESTLDEALDAVIAAGHSRIPVYRESIDDVVGVLYAKDLLPAFRKRSFDVSIADVMRPATFVPETKPVDELLRELKASKVHIAMVIDEHGGTAGLATIEDLLEEIVGEIQDEYDEEEPDIESVDPAAGTGVFRAGMDIDDANQLLEIDLPTTGEVDTLGGLVYTQLGKVPDAGDKARFANAEIEVLSVDGRRVERVRVVRVKEAEDDGRLEAERPVDA